VIRPYHEVAREERHEAQLERIDAHMRRISDGHDPRGHLLAIERLARSIRAEWVVEARGAADLTHEGTPR
jgi:hypothetical protein